MDRQGKTARPALKICGVTTARDLRLCVALGIDYVGLNLYPGSKRHLAPEAAARIVAEAGFPSAGGRTRLVAVLVDPTPAEVAAAVTSLPMLTALQLHGDESPATLLGHGARHPLALWKAFGVRSAADVTRASEYGRKTPGLDLMLFDAAPRGQERGGTGQSFDWRWLAEFGVAHPGTRFGVAGGVRPGAGLVTALAPLVTAGLALVDVCSGVESAPGIKDHDAVLAMQREVASLREVES